MLLKGPGSTALAVAVLGVAIGVNTTAFSIFNSILLRPLPVKESAQIVNLYRTTPGERRSRVFSYPEYGYFRDYNTVFSSLVAYAGGRMRLSTGKGGAGNTESEETRVQMVSANFFDALGATPVLGRGFLLEEDSGPGAHAVVVLSYACWRRRFGAGPEAVGKTITLNASSYTVVGVAPAGFLGLDPDPPGSWVPLRMVSNVWLDPNGQKVLESRNGGWLGLAARLKTGERLEQAQAELAVLAKRSGTTRLFSIFAGN
jgi:hypothetical protein